MAMRSVRALACMAAVAAAALAAPAQAQEEDGGRVERLRVALNGFENNITPFTHTFASSPNTHDLIMLVYDSLFWSQVRQEPEPWLAEKAVPSDDFRTWTVTLREGVEWHDGRPLTAEDVKFTFDYYRDTAPPGRYAHHVGDVPPYVRGEVVDERTVRLRFGAPAPTFKILPGADLPIIPKHVWEGVEDPARRAQQLPVGSGPFEVVEIESDQRYRLVANEDYFKGRPLVDELVMPIVKDPTAAFQALRAGQVDMVPVNVPPEVAEQFSRSPEIEVVDSTRLESEQIYFNARKEPLTDARLRKAISLAVDTDAIVERVLLGQGEPGHDSFIHPGSPWALPGAGHEHDVERARALLEEAGYREGTDGVRLDKDGEPLDIEVLVSSFDPLGLRAVQLAARQVREIGVRLRPEALDPASLRERTSGTPDQAPPADAYVGTLESHAHVDPDSLYYFFHSPGRKGFGAVFTGWGNEEFDRLVERATGLPAEERKPLLHEAQGILAEEAPLVTLWYRAGQWAYRPDAYDQWLADPGQGIFTKRSFLPGYERTATAAALTGEGGGGDGDGGFPAWLIAALAAGALPGVLLAARRRRRRRLAEEDEEGAF